MRKAFWSQPVYTNPMIHYSYSLWLVRGCVIYWRLEVQQAHFVLGQDGAYGVEARPIVVPLVLSILDEPARRETDPDEEIVERENTSDH